MGKKIQKLVLTEGQKRKTKEGINKIMGLIDGSIKPNEMKSEKQEKTSQSLLKEPVDSFKLLGEVRNLLQEAVGDLSVVTRILISDEFYSDVCDMNKPEFKAASLAIPDQISVMQDLADKGIKKLLTAYEIALDNT